MKVNRKTPAKDIQDLGQRAEKLHITTQQQTQSCLDFAQVLESAVKNITGNADQLEFYKNGRLSYHPDYHFNHNTPWTNKDQQYLIDHYDAQGPEELSLSLGRTYASIVDRVATLRSQGQMPALARRKYRKRHITKDKV